MKLSKNLRFVKSKHGFTLVELCVSMVVVSMIGVMIYSFLPLIMNRSKELSDTTVVAEDMQKLENAVNNFILHYDNNDYSFGYQGDTLFAYPKGGSTEDKKGQLSFNKSGKKIISESYISDDSEWNSSTSLANITSVSFTKANATGSEEIITEKNILINCSVEYKDTKDENKTVNIVFVTHAQGQTVRKVEK